MFVSQMIGTILGVLVNTGSVFIVLEGMKGLNIFKHPDWLATGYKVFLSAAGIWGCILHVTIAIGPARFFGVGTPYEICLVYLK